MKKLACFQPFPSFLPNALSHQRQSPGGTPEGPPLTPALSSPAGRQPGEGSGGAGERRPPKRGRASGPDYPGPAFKEFGRARRAGRGNATGPPGSPPLSYAEERGLLDGSISESAAKSVGILRRTGPCRAATVLLARPAAQAARRGGAIAPHLRAPAPADSLDA